MAAVLVLAAVTLTGCSQNAGPFMALLTNTGTSDDGADLAVEQETAADVFSRSGIYDSEDAAVVVKKDLEAGTVQFQNIATSRRYTLTYDGTTTVYDKNDQALSMEQLKEGSVVTVRFYKPRKALAYVKENPDCVSYSNVRSYSMDLRKGTIAIGDGALQHQRPRRCRVGRQGGGYDGSQPDGRAQRVGLQKYDLRHPCREGTRLPALAERRLFRKWLD